MEPASQVGEAVGEEGTEQTYVGTERLRPPRGQEASGKCSDCKWKVAPVAPVVPVFS